MAESEKESVREAFFLESERGSLFCLSTAPSGEVAGGLIFVPPFAEEMNKSRRMSALAARAFAKQGWLVLQPDFFGTGDSEGDFADADWETWLENLDRCWAWVTARVQNLPLGLWTLRAGSLLASDWLERSGVGANLLLWQPVSSGRQHLTQFLRLKAANEMLTEADARSAMGRFRAALEQGGALEVAGYGLSASLAQRLETADLNLCPGSALSVHAFEVVSGGRDDLSPGLSKLVRSCAERGVPCAGTVVAGSPFWSTQEIELVPALIDASAAVLDGWR